MKHALIMNAFQTHHRKAERGNISIIEAPTNPYSTEESEIHVLEKRTKFIERNEKKVK